MSRRKVTGKSGESWVVTVLLLFTASLILAANSLYMAEQLFEMSLNHDYVHFISIQSEKNYMGFPYDDGIYREDTGKICVTENAAFSTTGFSGEYS